MTQTSGLRRAWSAAFAVAVWAAVMLPPAAAVADSKSLLPELLKNMRPMQVRIVRSAEAGCEPDCAEWISAEGDIVDGTPAEFGRVFAQLGTRKLPVFVNSGGGSIEAAMVIGRMLRARQLDVSVTRTDFTACSTGAKNCQVVKGRARKVARGLPDSFSAYCASACTLVLAAGTQRLVSPWSHVGVHQIIVFKTQYRVRRTYRVTTLAKPGGGSYTRRILIREQNLDSKTVQLDVNDGTYAPMEIYLEQMGVDDSLVPLMQKTPNSDIHWMARQELTATLIATRQDSGDTLLKHSDVLPAGPAALGAKSAPDDHHIHAVVPLYFQGRPITLLFDAAYDKTSSQVTLSASLRQGDEVLRSQGLYTTFALGSGQVLNGYNANWALPFGQLEVHAPGVSVCPLRQSGDLQLSLHPVRPQDGELVPLQDTRPVTVPVASVPGLTELVAAACSTVASAGN